MDFPGLAPKAGVGVFGGGLFLDRWSGKAVAFRSDGLYQLRQDRVAPRFGAPFQVRIPHIDAPEIRFTLGDEGSGPSIQSLSVKIDGKVVFFDYDLATRTVRVDLSRLAAGRQVHPERGVARRRYRAGSAAAGRTVHRPSIAGLTRRVSSV